MITDLSQASIPVHPAASVFPNLTKAQFSTLVEDIRAHGIRESVWVDREGRLLDGRHRLRATQELGCQCPKRVYEGNDPVGFIISLNLHRRHLTESQRAIVAARLAKLATGRPSQKTPPIGGISTKAAAKALQVSTRTVERAKTVLKHGSPKIVRAVETGEMRVGPAAAIATTAHKKSQKIETPEIEQSELAKPTAPDQRTPATTATTATELVVYIPDVLARIEWIAEFIKGTPLSALSAIRREPHDRKRALWDRLVAIQGWLSGVMFMIEGNLRDRHDETDDDDDVPPALGATP